MQQSGVILFVDSDRNQLQSLQRSLRDQKGVWRLLFAAGEDEALAKMAQEPVDILVSETRLAGGSGSNLLNKAEEKHPLTTRLLFSGQALRQPAQEMVHHAHQFIAKPCSKEDLVAVLQRVMQLRGLLNNDAMREMINSLGTLPSLPDTYSRLIETLRSETASVKDVGKLIEQDMAMSAKVLQMVNSAFFGIPRRIASPAQAVTLLGIDTVTNLALSAGIFNQLSPSLVDAFGLNAMWQHSLNVAGLTRELYMDLGFTRQESEMPFLAGLLHDLGKLALISGDTDEYRRIADQADKEKLPLYVIEEESLWTGHASIGAYLMGLWGLPFEAVEAVALHHKTESQDSDHPQSLVVYAANLLIHNLTDNVHLDHYAIDELEAILDGDQIKSWMTITQEYLDGETP